MRVLAVGAAVAALIVIAAGDPHSVAAHEAGRLVVEPPIARPGERLTIHAEALWTEAPVTVTLVDPAGTERDLASGATSEAGSLEIAAGLPADLAAGTWEIVVENDAGEHVEGQVVIRASDPPIVPIALGVGAAVFGAIILVALVRRRGGQAAASPAS